MSLISRRKFLQRSAFAGAALYACPKTLDVQAKAVEQSVAPLDPAAIRKLASEVVGHVLTPDAPEYEPARLIFNRAFDLRPALIVRCAGASDVARALEFAQNRNLPLAVRGGGHSRIGYGMCDRGLVIDLSGMKSVEVDAGKRVARAGAGALVRDLDAATQRFNLATTSGGCPTVGIAG